MLLLYSVLYNIMVDEKLESECKVGCSFVSQKLKNLIPLLAIYPHFMKSSFVVFNNIYKKEIIRSNRKMYRLEIMIGAVAFSTSTLMLRVSIGYAPS